MDHQLDANNFENYHSELSKSCSSIGFIRKVVGILSAQLVLTVVTNFVILSNEGFVKTARSLNGFAVALGIVAILMIVCSDYCARKVPVNYVILGIATLCESISISAILSHYASASIFMAGAVTIGKPKIIR